MSAATRVSKSGVPEVRATPRTLVSDQRRDENPANLDRIALALERIAGALESRPKICGRDFSSDNGGKDVLSKLLPAIVGERGSREFTTKEVLANPVFAKIAGNRGAKKLGNLFSRYVNVPVDDLVLLKIGNDRGGAALWTIQRILPSLQSLKVSNKPTL